MKNHSIKFANDLSRRILCSHLCTLKSLRPAPNSFRFSRINIKRRTRLSVRFAFFITVSITRYIDYSVSHMESRHTWCDASELLIFVCLFIGYLLISTFDKKQEGVDWRTSRYIFQRLLCKTGRIVFQTSKYAFCTQT